MLATNSLVFFTRVRFDVSKITVLVTIRYRSDSVSITVFITVSLPFYRAMQTERTLFLTSTVGSSKIMIRNIRVVLLNNSLMTVTLYGGRVQRNHQHRESVEPFKTLSHTYFRPKNKTD